MTALAASHVVRANVVSHVLCVHVCVGARRVYAKVTGTNDVARVGSMIVLSADT